MDYGREEGGHACSWVVECCTTARKRPTLSFGLTMILCACHGSKGRGEADESSHGGGGGMGGSGAGGRPGGVASVAYRADRIESQVGR